MSSSAPYFPQNWFAPCGGDTQSNRNMNTQHFDMPWVSPHASVDMRQATRFFNMCWRRSLIYYGYIHRITMYQRSLEALENDATSAYGENNPYSSGLSEHMEFLERMAHDADTVLAAFFSSNTTTAAEGKKRLELMHGLFRFLCQGVSFARSKRAFVDEPGQSRSQTMRSMSSAYSTKFTYHAVKPCTSALRALVPDPSSSNEMFRYLLMRVIVHVHCCIGASDSERQFLAHVVERLTLLERVVVPQDLSDDVSLSTAVARALVTLMSMASFICGRDHSSKPFVRALRIRRDLKQQIEHALRSRQAMPSFRDRLSTLLPLCTHSTRESYVPYFQELADTAKQMDLPGWKIIDDFVRAEKQFRTGAAFSKCFSPPISCHFDSATDIFKEFVDIMYLRYAVPNVSQATAHDTSDSHSQTLSSSSSSSSLPAQTKDPRQRPTSETPTRKRATRNSPKPRAEPEKDMSGYVLLTEFTHELCDEYLNRVLANVDDGLRSSIKNSVHKHVSRALRADIRKMYDTKSRSAVVIDNDFASNTSPIVSMKYNARGVPTKTNSCFVRRDDLDQLKELMGQHCLRDDFGPRLQRKARSELRSELRMHNIPKDVVSSVPIVALYENRVKSLHEETLAVPPNAPTPSSDGVVIEDLPIQHDSSTARSEDSTSSIPFSKAVAHMVEAANSEPIDRTSAIESPSPKRQRRSASPSPEPLPRVSPARPPTFLDECEENAPTAHRQLPTMSILLAFPRKDDRDWSHVTMGDVPRIHSHEQHWESLRCARHEEEFRFSLYQWHVLNQALVDVLRDKVLNALSMTSTIDSEELWRYCFGKIDYSQHPPFVVELAEDRGRCMMTHQEERRIKTYWFVEHGVQLIRTSLQLCIDATHCIPLFVAFDTRVRSGHANFTLGNPFDAFLYCLRNNPRSSPVAIGKKARLDRLTWMYWHDPTQPERANDRLFALLQSTKTSRISRRRVLDWIRRNQYSDRNTTVHNAPLNHLGITPIQTCVSRDKERRECGSFTRLICEGVNTQRAKLQHRIPVPVCPEHIRQCNNATCQKNACQTFCFRDHQSCYTNYCVEHRS